MTITIQSGSSTFTLSASGTTASNAATRASGSGYGIYITGNNDVLTNTGTILGANDAVNIGNPGGVGATGDSVINQIGGYIHGDGSASSGVHFPWSAGAVTNAGTISSNGGAANGVVLQEGGRVTNLSTGTIANGGIYISGAAGTVVNSGKILGNSFYGGVDFAAGGVIANLAGTISASGPKYGIKIAGGAGTVTNAATITAGSAAGSAILLAHSYTNRVVADPGAVFVGIVDGGTPSLSTLELASGTSTGTVSGFGSQYVNFGTLTFDPGSAWLVKATTAIKSSVIYGFNSGDTIDLTGFTATSHTSISGGEMLVLTAGAVNETLTFGASISSFQVTTVASGTDIGTMCFCAGTRIATPAGEVPVEQLKQGDMVLTAHNGPRAIAWIGEGKVLAARGKRSAATPVIVRKGALGPDVPKRDLHVTKGHSLYLDVVLIPVEFLINHRSILWDDRAQEVHVFHVELETHDVLLADGALAESYRDDGNRWLFQNRNSGWDQPPKEPYAPVLTGGAVVDTVWRRLLDRTGPLVLPPMTDDADPHLVVDDACVEVSERRGDAIVFHLPRSPKSVRLRSRSMVPCEFGLARDPRCLGVAVRRVSIRRGHDTVTIRAHDRRLTNGFHDYEPDGDLRWTNGDAALPAEAFAPFGHAIEVVVQLGGSTRYSAFEERAA
jgi:hypothetical protein